MKSERNRDDYSKKGNRLISFLQLGIYASEKCIPRLCSVSDLTKSCGRMGPFNFSIKFVGDNDYSMYFLLPPVLYNLSAEIGLGFF